MAKGKIREIEDKLIEEGRGEKRRWAAIAGLMMEVEENELFRPNYKSFTAWVRSVAQRAGLQESSYWRALRAGRYVAKLEGSGVIETDQVTAGAETIELAEKIDSEADMPDDDKRELVERALKGDATRSELRGVWQSSRPQGRQGSAEEAKSNEAAIAAAESQQDTGRWTESSVIGVLYTCFTSLDHGPVLLSGREMPVQSPTTDRDRRVDWVALSKSGLVGFEVKVSVNDLENDQKLGDYKPALDYLYIAIPEDSEMIEMARRSAGDGIGIVAVSKKNGVQLYKGATERTSKQRSEPFAAASAAKMLYRMIKLPWGEQ